MKIEMSLSGRYLMEAVNVKTGVRRFLAEFDNLITDIGLNQLGSGGAVGYCRVGSGSTPPAVTDSSLVSQLASTSSVQTNTGGHSSAAPWYGYYIKTYRFAAGVAAGNVSEVGIGWAATGSTLFSRALVKDALGDPTTITVLSDEYLDVTYEVRNYSPTADTSFVLAVSGTNYNVTGRTASANSSWNPQAIIDYGMIYPYNYGTCYPYTGLIGAVTSTPAGTNLGGVSSTLNGYSNNSLKRSGRFTWALDNGNGVIKSFYLVGVGGNFQFQLDNTITKTNDKVFTLDFEWSWARKP